MPQPSFVKTIAEIGGGETWRPSTRQQSWKELQRLKLIKPPLDVPISTKKKVNHKPQLPETPSRKKQIQMKHKQKTPSKRKEVNSGWRWDSYQVENCLLNPEEYLDESEDTSQKPSKLLSERYQQNTESKNVRSLVGPLKAEEELAELQSQIGENSVITNTPPSIRDSFYGGYDLQKKDEASEEGEGEKASDWGTAINSSTGESAAFTDLMGASDREATTFFGSSPWYTPWKSKAYKIHGKTFAEERAEKILAKQKFLAKYENHHWKSSLFNDDVNGSKSYTFTSDDLPYLKPTVRCRTTESVRNPITGEEFRHNRVNLM